MHTPYPSLVSNIEGDAIPPVPLNDNDVIWVDNITSLQKMIDSLKRAREVAVDLEHHDYRSYYGFVCLMQISTREQDWIVDTLELREELIILNEIFTDPNIIKVFPSLPIEKTNNRYSMERDQTSFGYNVISVYTSLIHSIHIMPLMPSNSLINR
jgi:3'-5' exonuclease